MADCPDPVDLIARLDPKGGLPAWPALYHFVDSERAASLYRSHDKLFGPNGKYRGHDWLDDLFDFSMRGAGYRSNRLKLQQDLLQMLIDGDLVGRGFLSSDALDAERRIIVADRWQGLSIDVLSSTATGTGQTIVNLLILDPALEARPRGRGTRPSFSPAAVRRWYANRVEDCRASGREPSRDDDFREANAAGLGTVPRDILRDLRREFAPGAWTRKGKRPTRRKTETS